MIINYKKIISLIIAILIASISSLTYATVGTSSGYKDVIQTEEFNFTADLESDGSVELEWDKIETTGEFKYYKIVRSSTNSSPKYPEDGYIKYSTDIDFTEYTDYSPKSGTNYYRICKIMTDGNRYCSKTQKIYIDSDTDDDDDSDNDDNDEDNGYKTPIITDDFNLELIQEDNKITLEWDKIEHENNFKYYKIMRGTNDNNLFYPNRSAIGVYTDDDKTSFTDYKPYNGTNYYRVCLITDEKDRYCSHVEDAYYSKDNNSSTTTANAYGISTAVKAKLNTMIKKFFKKLEERDITSDEKIEALEKIIDALDNLAENKPSLKTIVNYLNILIKRQIQQYESSDGMTDIEAIFNDNI